MLGIHLLYTLCMCLHYIYICIHIYIYSCTHIMSLSCCRNPRSGSSSWLALKKGSSQQTMGCTCCTWRGLWGNPSDWSLENHVNGDLMDFNGNSRYSRPISNAIQRKIHDAPTLRFEPFELAPENPPSFSVGACVVPASLEVPSFSHLHVVSLGNNF